MAATFEDVEKKINQIKRIYERSHNAEECIKILEQCQRDEIDEIFSYLSKNAPQVYVAINDNIVLFEDLVQLDAKGVQMLLQEFNPKLVGLALRLGTPRLRDNIFTYCSKDDRELMEEILSGPGQKRSDVEAAIQRIMNYIRPKVKNGTFKIVGGQDPKLSGFV